MRRVLLAALSALVLGLAACGTAARGADSGGGTDRSTLKLGLSRQLTSLDPAQSGSIDSDADVQAAVFSGLTRIDPDQKVVGDLATAWTQTAATTWEFTVRSGVTFSNGDPLDANTIVWNFQRVLDPKATFATGGTLRPIISGATAPSPTTVDITTKYPYIDLPQTLSNFFFTEQSWVAAHNPTLETLGSGPYKVVSVDLENGVKLTRNPHYYGTAPFYDNVEFKVLASEAARVSALQTHAVDVAIQLEPDDLKQLANSRYATGTKTSSWNMVFRLNETKAPLDNKDVRLALNYAIDKATIAKGLLGASVQPAPGQVLVSGYDSVNPNVTAYPYDPEKAKSLLAQAGFANGLDLTLNLSSGTYTASDSVAQVVAQQLAKVGVRLHITKTPFPTWVTQSRTKDAADLLYIGYSSGYPGPAQRLLIYTSTYSQSHYQDPTYDDLVKKVFAAPDRAAQQDLVNQATQQFHDDAHVVFLWPQPLTYAIAKDLSWTPRPEHWLLPQDIKPTA